MHVKFESRNIKMEEMHRIMKDLNVTQCGDKVLNY